MNRSASCEDLAAQNGMTPEMSQSPVKSYNLIQSHALNPRNLEVQQDNQTVYWIGTPFAFLSSRQLNIHQDSSAGPIVASAKFPALSRGVTISLGNSVIEADCQGITNKQYGFVFHGRTFVWRRTHDAGLGASSLRQSDFKLLDVNDESRVLAVFIRTVKFLNVSEKGRLDWFVDLGRDLELTSMAVILGIEDRLRRARSAGASASAS